MYSSGDPLPDQTKASVCNFKLERLRCNVVFVDFRIKCVMVSFGDCPGYISLDDNWQTDIQFTNGQSISGVLLRLFCSSVLKLLTSVLMN